MDFLKLFEECRLCPRNCGVNRKDVCGTSRAGFCEIDHRLRVAYIGAHFGEEPPISGTRGSGTVFFSGCSLLCSYCQNHQISRSNVGDIMDMAEFSKKVLEMIGSRNVHNINFVTPDHFFPYTFQLVDILRRKGFDLPKVYNVSGYQSVPILKMAEEYADIYLPDYKYADPSLSLTVSKCKDYPRVALGAITEMVRQKGFLDSFSTGSGLAGKGVLVRHLILPGWVCNSLDALSTLFIEFGPGLPLSLMSQFQPVLPNKDRALNRCLTRDEFDRVFGHAMELGFENLFVQFPDEKCDGSKRNSSFLPDFSLKEPFRSNGPAKDPCV